ncbi:hypothetical protein AB5I41_23930 [Sphingomonas sp. MMS24-JH45]
MIAVGGFKVFPSRDSSRPPPASRGTRGTRHRRARPSSGERVRAYVTLDKAADGEALRTWLNPQIGKHKRVDLVVVRDDLPQDHDRQPQPQGPDCRGACGGGVVTRP